MRGVSNPFLALPTNRAAKPGVHRSGNGSGRAGQGATGRVAGAERAGIQRSQDPHRSLSEGFDFLGFNLRGYPSGKLLIKPGATAIKRFRSRLGKEFHALRGASVAAVLAKIVPIVGGWVACYRTVVSSRVFAALTGYLWKLTCKWACRTHPNKPKRWIAGRYFGKFSKFRNDRWVFGDKDTGACLPKPSWTDIVRHTLVKGGASPDDPALAGYRAQRRQKVKPPLDSCTLRLLSRQDGRCS